MKDKHKVCVICSCLTDDSADGSRRYVDIFFQLLGYVSHDLMHEVFCSLRLLARAANDERALDAGARLAVLHVQPRAAVVLDLGTAAVC